MGNTIIKINCQDQALEVVRDPVIATGGIGASVVEFTFGELWNGFTKTATFYRSPSAAYTVVLGASGLAAIPQEVLTTDGVLYIGVFGVSGSVTRTSEVIRYNVRQGAITSGSTPTVTPSVYEQLLAAINNANATRTVTDKRLANILEASKGTIWSETTDSTAALTKTVPTGAQAYAEIVSVGGKTEVVGGALVSAPVTSIVSKDSDSATIQTITIPAAVQALTGYGWSVGNGAIRNEIDWRALKYIQRVGRIDLGSLEWWVSNVGTYQAFGSSTWEHDPITGAVLSKLGTLNAARVSAGNAVGVQLGTANRVYVVDGVSTTVGEITTAMSGAMLYYELVTPVETDISGIISADNMIEVEAGGTITFTNTNNLAAPSTVKYTVKI